tara:strand:+ start:866 stop:1567 length:702 start_codon:yes stop_codon:yes gene_type:complete
MVAKKRRVKKKILSKKTRRKKEVIFVFGAHSDDFVLGAGGTIAKYVEEGKNVISIVFSSGEKSHPWLKRKVVTEMRSEEASEASKILKCKTLFFDLEDQKVQEDYQKNEVEKKLLRILKTKKPTRIFTHGNSMVHPDHRAVHKITLGVWDKLPKPKPEVYAYPVWSPMSLKHQYPILYEDISHTFSLKIKALNTFHSQKTRAIYQLILPIFYRAIMNGFKIKKRFAEKFYRLK